MLLIFLFANLSQAQELTSSVKSISSEKLALIKEYFEVSGARETYKQKLNSIFDSVDKTLLKQIQTDTEQDTTLTSEERAKRQKELPLIAIRLTKRLRDEFSKELNYEKLVEDANYPLLDKYFTEEDLKQLIAIYKSPVWKKSISVQQQLQAETSKLFVDTLIATIQKIMPRVRDAELEEVRKKKTQDE